jgi:hypothetical protein
LSGYAGFRCRPGGIGWSTQPIKALAGPPLQALLGPSRTGRRFAYDCRLRPFVLMTAVTATLCAEPLIPGGGPTAVRRSVAPTPHVALGALFTTRRSAAPNCVGGRAGPTWSDFGAAAPLAWRARRRRRPRNRDGAANERTPLVDGRGSCVGGHRQTSRLVTFGAAASWWQARRDGRASGRASPRDTDAAYVRFRSSRRMASSASTMSSRVARALANDSFRLKALLAGRYAKM